MSIDLSKLTPAPCIASNDECPCVYSPTTSYESPVFEPLNSTPEDAGVALARNAFDVMMRRKWGVSHNDEWGWVVVNDHGEYLRRNRNEYGGFFVGADPFAALVEADKWYRENVEKAGQ